MDAQDRDTALPVDPSKGTSNLAAIRKGWGPMYNFKCEPDGEVLESNNDTRLLSDVQKLASRYISTDGRLAVHGKADRD